jgi:hypothetical protein
MWGQLRDDPSDNLTERAYQTLLPDVEASSLAGRGRQDLRRRKRD